MYLNRRAIAAYEQGAVFNFNKSCIWIQAQAKEAEQNANLTLTRVVFE